MMVLMPASVLRAAYRNGTNIGNQESDADSRGVILVAAAICSVWLVPLWPCLRGAFTYTKVDWTALANVALALFALVVLPAAVGYGLARVVREYRDRLAELGFISSRTVPLFERMTQGTTGVHVRFRMKNLHSEGEALYIGEAVRGDAKSILLEKIRVYNDEIGDWGDEHPDNYRVLLWDDGRVTWFERKKGSPSDRTPVAE